MGQIDPIENDYRLIGQVGRVFANGPGDLGSIPGRVIPKILKMVLDTSLLNTQQYKVCVKGIVEQSWEKSSALPYTSVLLLLKREPCGRSRLLSPTLRLVKLATIVEGDLKVPLSIATTPRCREGATPFPGLLLFTLDMYLVMLSIKQGGIKYHFLKSLVWPRSPGP